jgi:hypothetical protein
VDNQTSIPYGQNYTIMMQVLLGGGDYPKGSIGIYLVSNNTSVLDIPDSAMAATNSSGIALYNLTPDQVKPGNAMVTAILLDKRTGVRASKNYTIVNTGNITGTVTDSAGEPVQVARVTAYQPVNGTMQFYPASGNPTYSATNTTGLPGTFRITGLPYGTYYVEASFAANTFSVNYTVNGVEKPVTIALAGYTIATPTPLPTPTTVPSATATTVATPTPAPTPSGDRSKQVLWIGALAIVLAIIIIAVVVLTRKK